MLSIAFSFQAFGQIQNGFFNGTRIPLYIGSTQGGSFQLPVVYRARVTGLAPNSSYKYFSRGIVASDFSSNSLYVGAGNPLFLDSGSWKTTTTPNLSTASAHDTFWTNGAGEYEGWFGFVYTSDSRFTKGNKIYPYIGMIGMTAGDTVRYYCQDSMNVLAFGTNPGGDTGTGIWGHSIAPAKSFVALYDDAAGFGRPLAVSMVENDGVATGAGTVGYYATNVQGVAGNWGVIIPNNIANGIRKIENLDRYTGNPVYSNTDNDGVWGPNNKNTVKPTGGTTAISLNEDDAALVPPDVQFWTRNSTVSEGTATKEIYVVRKYGNSTNTTVRLSIVGGTATQGTGKDYLLTAPFTVTFKANGPKNDTTKITILEDNSAEGDENITLRLDQPVNCVIGTEVAHTVTINDNDFAIVKPSATKYVVKENAGVAGIKIKIDKAVSFQSSMRLLVKKQGDSSFIPGEFRLGTSNRDTVFSIGKTTGPDSTIIYPRILDDVNSDPHDTFIFALRQISGLSTVQDSVFTLIVLDNDGPSIVKFLGTKATVQEKQSSIDLKILIPYRTDAGADFTLRLLTTQSTATQGSDFTFSPSSKVFSIDNLTPDTIVVNVPLLDDNIYEPTEKIIFTLGKLSNVTIQKPDTFTITIINDDLPTYKLGLITAQSGVNKTLDSNNVKCRLSGVVYGGNVRNGGLQFTLGDNTGAISVLSTSKTFGYTPTEKDSVMVQGTITQVQGMAQITSLDTIIKMGSNRPINNPIPTTDVKEASESKLIKISRVKLVDPSQWPTTALASNSSKVIKVSHTSGVEDSILLDAETHSWHTVAAPSGYINVTGLGGQADPSSPFTVGHYISPRNLSDIEAAILPTVKFSKTSDTITELADSFRMDFVMSNLEENFTFDVVVKQASASSPKDYDFSKKTVKVIKNNSVSPIKANISDDTEGDGPKDLTFVIRNIVGPGSIGADSMIYLYIKDNEANSVKKLAQGNIKMYPNPANETLFFNSKVGLDKIEIIALDGRMVLSTANQSGQFTMDISQLAPGAYNIRVMTVVGDVYSEQLIKK